MHKNGIQKLSFFIFATISCITAAMGQTAVTVDNLALTVGSGLTMTISGDFKNQNGGTIDNAGTITVSGNWTNNASNSVFSTSSGTVQMIGTSAQTIDGSNATSFYNLTLNNSLSSATRYSLGKNQTVNNTLTLSAGELNLANYTLTIGASAASPGSVSYTAGWLYGGTLTRWFGTSTIANGASAGLFPIGSSADYRPFYLSAPTVAPTSGGTISISHTNTAGTTPVSFTDINVTIDRIFNSYWTMATGNGLNGGTYNMRLEGTGFTGITDYTALRITLAGSSLGTNGTNAGSNANPQVNRTGLTLAQLTNTWYIGYPAAAALPIELVSFHAYPHQAEVNVDWTTATEINADFFTVEKSADGITYDDVATIQAAGNSSNILYYATMDHHPLHGLSFYRLKETDVDGSFTYSSPVSVRFDDVANDFDLISTYSNNDQLTATIYSSVNESFTLDLYDSLGRLLAHKDGILSRGFQDVAVPYSTYSSGICLFTIQTSRGRISKKIL